MEKSKVPLELKYQRETRDNQYQAKQATNRGGGQPIPGGRNRAAEPVYWLHPPGALLIWLPIMHNILGYIRIFAAWPVNSAFHMGNAG